MLPFCVTANVEFHNICIYGTCPIRFGSRCVPSLAEQNLVRRRQIERMGNDLSRQRTPDTLYGRPQMDVLQECVSFDPSPLGYHLLPPFPPVVRLPSS